MSTRQPELFATDIPPWELDSQSECRAAKVVFSEAPHGPLDYRVPDEMLEDVCVGVRVKVPLGRSNREMLGYCIAVETVRAAPDTLKCITEVVDAEPLCTPKVLELLQWMSRYYIAPLGQVFEAAIPAGVRASAGSRQRMVLYPTLLAEDDQRLGSLPPKQQDILRQLILVGGAVTIDQLRKMANCSTAPINALREAGLIDARQERIYSSNSAATPLPSGPPLALSADQRLALREILDALDSAKQQTVLLHGITGSGKTEVYMQAIHEVITYGRQAIVLVPEISLTPQARQRFVSALWTSGRAAQPHEPVRAASSMAEDCSGANSGGDWTAERDFRPPAPPGLDRLG
jgi:primosomal protein N' (replication factor Y) (superfamily II helicase)